MSEQSIDPRIVHVASELSVSLGPQAENDGNMEYILDVIAAVDYANETCDRDFVAGVKAAREAVAALDHAPRCELTWGCECSERHPMECTCNRDAAIAAIDALRGGS